jgi:hypothetical protein
MVYRDWLKKIYEKQLHKVDSIAVFTFSDSFFPKEHRHNFLVFVFHLIWYRYNEEKIRLEYSLGLVKIIRILIFIIDTIEKEKNQFNILFGLNEFLWKVNTDNKKKYFLVNP